MWFKIDDGFWAHPKVLGLSDSAVALWVRAGSYCAQQLTDGRLRADALPMLRSDEFVAAELVKAGLWVQTPDGYEYHDWAKYQPTRESVEAQREEWRERQRRARGVTRDSRPASPAKSRGVDTSRTNDAVDKFTGAVDNSEDTRNSAGAVTRDTHRESTSPVPSRPVHDSSNDESQKREADALDVVVDSTFDQVWAHWPKKTSKKTAQAKFELAARRHPRGIRGLAADIVEHARAYERFEHPVEYVPMLSTWLNGDRWDDPLPGPRGGTPSQNTQNASVLARYAHP